MINHKTVQNPNTHQQDMINVFMRKGYVYDRKNRFADSCGATPMAVYQWLLINTKPSMHPDDIAFKWTIAPIYSLHEIIKIYGESEPFYHYKNHLPVYRGVPCKIQAAESNQLSMIIPRSESRQLEHEQRLEQKRHQRLKPQIQQTEKESYEDRAINAIVMEIVTDDCLNVDQPVDAIVVEEGIINKSAKTRRKRIKKSASGLSLDKSSSIYTRTRHNSKIGAAVESADDIVIDSGVYPINTPISATSTSTSTPTSTIGITNRILNHTTKRGRLHPLVRQHLPQIVDMSMARTGRHPGIWLLPSKKRINK